jgi:Flp pilus assembly protein TadG
MRLPRRLQSGQAIVLIAFIMVVLLGFLGLAIDGGRAYLDRRQLQAAADAAVLAAAHNYMNNTSYDLAERAATAAYATNEHLYMSPGCTGYGTASASCSFADPSGQVLALTVVNRSIAGVYFTATASHVIPVTIMQVVGIGPTIPVSATATAVARQKGTGGAAIQTLSPACTGGVGTISLAFTGTSTTKVIGDIWSNGGITDGGTPGGSVNGNVVGVCPTMPPGVLPSPSWTVTGVQTNGLSIGDPGYGPPTLITAGRTWSGSQVNQQPGTYAADPKLAGGAGCYFLAPGVYDWAGGLTDNGGFISNELRPPDEPSSSTTSSAVTGTVTSIPVAALTSGIGAGTALAVGGQTFTVASGGAAVGATSIPVNSSSVSATIPAGSVVSGRASTQFWDANGVQCAGSFQPYPVSSSSPVAAHAWAIEVTAVRWEFELPNGVGSCSGPISANCSLRESPPSMCRIVDAGSGQAIQVWVSNVPGAVSYNVYADPTGTCAGPFGYVKNFANTATEQNTTTTGCAPQFSRNSTPSLSKCDLGSSSTTVDSTVLPVVWTPNPLAAPSSSGASPPDGEGGPIGPNLPNSVPPTNTWPSGDRANENYCVGSTGTGVKCQAGVSGLITPGAVTFYIPGGGGAQVCLNLQGGGDVYVFTGYQYGRILLYEPGALQQPPANTCSNNVNGHGLTSLLGIFYIPAASAVITGNSGYFATIAGGVITWTAEIKGTGAVSITADPSLRTWPSAVHLVQ